MNPKSANLYYFVYGLGSDCKCASLKQRCFIDDNVGGHRENGLTYSKDQSFLLGPETPAFALTGHNSLTNHNEGNVTGTKRNINSKFPE